MLEIYFGPRREELTQIIHRKNDEIESLASMCRTLTEQNDRLSAENQRLRVAAENTVQARVHGRGFEAMIKGIKQLESALSGGVARCS